MRLAGRGVSFSFTILSYNLPACWFGRRQRPRRAVHTGNGIRFMKLTKTAVLAAALAVSCATITLHAAPANAITLMDILRGGKKKEPVREPLPGVGDCCARRGGP